jgi:hypothetical protein
MIDSLTRDSHYKGNDRANHIENSCNKKSPQTELIYRQGPSKYFNDRHEIFETRVITFILRKFQKKTLFIVGVKIESITKQIKLPFNLFGR